MKLLDHADMPAVVRFLLRQLDRIDTDLIESITLTRSLRKYLWNGYSETRASGLYRLRCAIVNDDEALRELGVRCRECHGRVDDAGPCRACGCRLRDSFADGQEVMAFLVGHEMYHYMVSTEQAVSAAQDEERDADAHGREWLRRWRCGAHRRR